MMEPIDLVDILIPIVIIEVFIVMQIVIIGCILELLGVIG